MYKIQSELLGAFFLTVVIGLTSNFLAIGLILVALIYLGSGFSGSHYNPAVTIGAWISEEISTKQCIRYIFAQFIGAVLGSLLVWWIAETTFAPEPARSTSVIEFAVLEVLFSLLFVLVFLVMMFPEKKRKNPVYGIVIGLTLTACYMIADPITGTGLNPAISAAYILLDTINHGYSYYNTAVYILAPLVGGVGAAAIFRKMNPL